MAEHAAVDEQWRIPDELWERIEPFLPEERAHPRGGRPWMPARQAMDATFYVPRAGFQPVVIDDRDPLKHGLHLGGWGSLAEQRR